MIGIDLGIKPQRIFEHMSSIVLDEFENGENKVCSVSNNWLLTNIFEDSPSGFALIRGSDFIFEKVNSHWCSLVSKREYIGRSFFDVYPEASLVFYLDLKNTYETGITFVAKEIEARVEVKADVYESRYYDYSYIRILDKKNKPYGILCNAIDVSERVKAQDKRIKTEANFLLVQERLTEAMSVSAIGFYDWSILEDEVIFNEQMQKDWKLGKKSSLQLALSRIHPEDRNRVANLINESIEYNKNYFAEYRLLHSDGSVVWIEAQGKVSYNQSGKAIRFLGTSLNISAKKEIQIELEKAKSNADQANQAKSDFLAHMSHEIRTPLAAISGFSDLLHRALIKNTGNEIEYLSIIRKNTHHLLHIIEDVLDLSKVEAERISIENIQFSLKDFLTDFLALTELKVREKNIQFHMRIVGVLPEKIISDPTRLRQILVNIVGNAIKFTDEGDVFLEISSSENTMTMRVEDTGIGIDGLQQKKLFQAFVQADSSTTRKFGGTGLGLILTKKLCKILGGSFKLIESKPDQGSVFEAKITIKTPEKRDYFSLLDIQPTLKISTDFLGEDCDLSNLKILIVEDISENQKLFQLLISSTGAIVVLANNGEEGVKKALSEKFDVILMDIQMPVMDGHQATKILRSKGCVAPIVAVTAHAMKEDRWAVANSGFTHYLSKPILRKKLFDILSEISSSK